MKARLSDYLKRPAGGAVKTYLQTPLCEVASAAAEWSEPGSVRVDGREFAADGAVGFVVMDVIHAFPSVTAYGTALHPRTIARHFRTLEHKVFNLGHRMRAYLTEAQRARLPASEQRDMMLGSVVAVEFPPEPPGGWRLSASEPAPCVRACASFAKQSEAAAVVAKHGGRWSVSQEINFQLADSGFLVMQPERVPDQTLANELLSRCTPAEVHALGLGYVPCVEAPEALLACFAGGAIQRQWHGSDVVLLKGGLGDGEVHWIGMGYVQVPAEAEARIVTILAQRPAADPLVAVFRELERSGKKFLTTCTKKLATGAQTQVTNDPAPQ